MGCCQGGVLEPSSVPREILTEVVEGRFIIRLSLRQRVYHCGPDELAGVLAGELGTEARGLTPTVAEREKSPPMGREVDASFGRELGQLGKQRLG